MSMKYLESSWVRSLVTIGLCLNLLMLPSVATGGVFQSQGDNSLNCGPAVAAMLINMKGGKTTAEGLRAFKPWEFAWSAKTIARAVKRRGISLKLSPLSLGENLGLYRIKLLGIPHWVLAKRSVKGVLVLDPAKDRAYVTTSAKFLPKVIDKGFYITNVSSLGDAI